MPKLVYVYTVMYLKRKFQTLYISGTTVAADESLMLFKGRLSLKQYIPLM
jgi:hypothetical protein